MSTAENIPASYDFHDAIYNAISCAPLVELSESGLSLSSALVNAKKLKGIAEVGDATLVPGFNIDLPGDIIIEDAHAFPVLVRQAMKAIYPPFTSKQQLDAWSRESLEHEMAHAAAANMLYKDVRYGVRIVKVKVSNETRLLMTCFINLLDQDITIADLAFITAAPENLSEGDGHVLRSLGNTSLQT
ncbi:MAG: hypothetical protein JWO96_230 [Candidatus Saccharibacteria bacterium]|nr:hypothetical protein [Candidatus Saccharibacteria bacterium]